MRETQYNISKEKEEYYVKSKELERAVDQMSEIVS